MYVKLDSFNAIWLKRYDATTTVVEMKINKEGFNLSKMQKHCTRKT